MSQRKILSGAVMKLAVLVALATAGLHGQSARAAMVEAWGTNTYGQLGDGTTTSRNAPVAVIGLPGGAVTAIAGGEDHSLVVLNGGVYAWGYNGAGQLGDGTKTNHSTPVATIGLSSGVTALAGGMYHSLAIQNGGVQAWGDNGYGQLGDGTLTQHLTPVPATGLSSGVTAIAAGDFFSLAVQNGGVQAWGYNYYGQLGDGTTAQHSAPAPVSGLGSGVTAVAAGSNHSLAVQNGAVFAWGRNLYGQLGIGGTADHHAPGAVTALSGGVTSIAAGDYDSLAVQNGGVYAWGFNGYGQVGDGTTTNRSTPVHIDPADLTNIVAVAAGRESSYALSADGSLWVWGGNNFGELGLGSATTQYLTPQHLLPPTGYVFTSIAAGRDYGYHAVATLAVVPEPATLSLLALGGVPLLCRRRHTVRVPKLRNPG